MNRFSVVIIAASILVNLTFIVFPEYLDHVSGEDVESEISVFESFIDGNNCDGDFDSVERLDSDVSLNWIHGEGSSLAGQQRAEKLGADACSQWQNGESLENATAISSLAKLTLTVDIVATEQDGETTTTDVTQSAGLLLEVEIEPLEDLEESLNLRWYVTVDHTPVGNGIADDVVLHYGWSSSFYHQAGNTTNWTQVIDSERLTEDGIPFTINDLWRLEVTVMLVDDLNATVSGIDHTQVQTLDRIPNIAGMFPVIILVIAIVAGLVIIVRQDYQREVGLPLLTGTLRYIKKEWIAEVRVTAGKYDLTIKGASATLPWKMSRVPKQQLVPAGTSRNFSVKLRSTEENNEAETHWEVEVEELGGWVLDLKLPVHKNE
ncbi:MAG TPA: hypothetical protein EYQ78_03990 [Candidatus Poseidoniales archaeon]|nr:hypothetical protein [Candidatus Poseidoniales archaeon]